MFYISINYLKKRLQIINKFLKLFYFIITSFLNNIFLIIIILYTYKYIF